MCITDHYTDGKRIHSTWKSRGFPTSCKRRFPQFHDTASYTHSHSAYDCEHPSILSYLKDCAAHPAFTVSLPVPDKVAVLFKLTERGENGIRTFLADCRKSLG